MFSSALKSFSSNISSNYSLAQQPSCACGPWRIFDGKKRVGGKLVSVFVFDRKTLEPQGGLGRSSGGVGLKQAQDEVVERLKKEAASLARLRHPSILELAEPVEETSRGGLIFATEPITSSLAGMLDEKDEQERTNGVNGRSSRYVVDDPGGGGKRRREIEIDELEIQKGLVQIGKGLEFLHESAGLVHGNLTPDAIFINTKSDWKLSGLGFSTPPEGGNNPSVAPMALSEVLNHDARLPRHVQLNLDYASPDLVMDNNITPATDMFSLGLVIIALYNSPHRSPLDTSMSVSTYRRILSSPSSTPTQRNNYLSTQPIPQQVLSALLPRLITRRPAQRSSAREFQQGEYFDSILVSTLRFLDTLPAKTANEKAQFFRGLPRIMPQFPKSVLEKKVLPALLEEAKDVDLLSPVLDNVFKIVETVPNSKRVFSERVLPRLKEVFAVNNRKGKPQEPDMSKEGGLVVVLEHMSLAATHCSGKEFKDDMLPILFLGFESPTHSIQDAALSTLSIVLPVLDFSTVKNELFTIVAQVFSKTSSMAIKIRGLEAFNVLCGGTNIHTISKNTAIQTKSGSSSTMLDKYTIQEKIVPLLRAIKTKEPAVMMAALQVFKQVGKVADVPFLAHDVLPCLWAFSLGPLLNLDQFQEFMILIKVLSTRIEEEQTRKLQQLGGRGGGAYQNRTTNGAGDETDFESLVTGRSSKTNGAPEDAWESGWDEESSTKPTHTQSRQQQTRSAATFSWSTTNAEPARKNNLSVAPAQASRAITPDQMSSFASITPSRPIQQGSSLSQPLQPSQPSRTFTASQPARLTNNNGSKVPSWANSSDANNPWSMPQPTSTLQLQPSNSNPWASSGTQNPWAGQNNNLNDSLSSMKLDPPRAGGSAQMSKPTSSGMDKYDSLI